MLRQIKQEEGEKIAIFAMRLRLQGEKCDYGGALDDNVKELLIGNCRSSQMRTEMMKEVMKREMNLKKLVDFAQVIEAVTEQEKPFKSSKNLQMEEVNKIQSKSAWSNPVRSNNDKTAECNRCGSFGHKSFEARCPAKGKTCYKCSGSDHFSRKCRSRKRTYNHHYNQQQFLKSGDNMEQKVKDKSPSTKRKQEETVKFVANANNEDYVFCIKTNDRGNEIKCCIGGIETNAIIDSGSKYNLLDFGTWQKLKSMNVVVANQRKESEKVFKSYGDHTLSILGVFEAEIQVAENNVTADFYVIKESGKFLIGRETATKLGILKIGYHINEIGTINKSNKIGHIKGIVVDIPIKVDARPVIQPYRRVPVPLEKAVDNKIDELLGQDIIEHVNQPSKWISPVVVVPKGDDVRICIDMRCANKAVERENHPLPTMEDFLPHIGKSKWFSKIDIKNAFHQVGIFKLN